MKKKIFNVSLEYLNNIMYYSTIINSLKIIKKYCDKFDIKMKYGNSDYFGYKSPEKLVSDYIDNSY